MTAFQFLKGLEFLPNSVEREKTGRASNSQIRRWLTNSAVIINGVTPSPDDEVRFPITELVFFPHGERRTTMVKMEDLMRGSS